MMEYLIAYPQFLMPQLPYDTAIKEIKKLGKGAFIAKSDIESAFNLLPVRKQDYHLLGFKWKDRYYYERALPMGCSSSCRLFESFSSALEHLVKYFARSDKVVHVLDDFFVYWGR